jgi:hypothetical protein
MSPLRHLLTWGPVLMTCYNLLLCVEPRIWLHVWVNLRFGSRIGLHVRVNMSLIHDSSLDMYWEQFFLSFFSDLWVYFCRRIIEFTFSRTIELTFCRPPGWIDFVEGQSSLTKLKFTLWTYRVPLRVTLDATSLHFTLYAALIRCRSIPNSHSRHGFPFLQINYV